MYTDNSAAMWDVQAYVTHPQGWDSQKATSPWWLTKLKNDSFSIADLNSSRTLSHFAKLPKQPLQHCKESLALQVPHNAPIAHQGFSKSLRTLASFLPYIHIWSVTLRKRPTLCYTKSTWSFPWIIPIPASHNKPLCCLPSSQVQAIPIEKLSQSSPSRELIGWSQKVLIQVIHVFV